jgi:hypothetical protein
VYERVEQFRTYMRNPVRACWLVRDSPASLMTRGYQCSKAYYIVFANAQFIYIAWELPTVHIYRMGASDASLEHCTCSTSWSLRVSQARALHRIIKIRNDPTLLSDSMASLMDGSITTSRARVQRRSSALYRQKQLWQAGAGAARGGRQRRKLCNEE